MPRISSPIIPEPQLMSGLQAEIDRLGWQTVRNQILEQYEQRLQAIRESGLSKDEISKKRVKKLSKDELTTLALCFLAHLIELQTKGQDTEEAIRELTLAETELLEKGYPSATIAKNHHPLYINLVRHAIESQQLVLDRQNSYLIPIPDKDTGELTELPTHYAQLYLKYDDLFYLNLKRSTTANNNIKQDIPKPVVLPLYLDRVNYLLNSQSYPELAAGIAAASGRRFSELIKGNFSLPQDRASPYKLLFEGQLKKKEVAEAYLTYSIVPASKLLEAIARWRTIPKIQSLAEASI